MPAQSAYLQPRRRHALGLGRAPIKQPGGNGEIAVTLRSVTDRDLKLGFGIAAGLDSELAGEIGSLCAGLGYSSLWSNDHPAASGLEMVADLAAGAPALDLGVGALALDRHDPEGVAVKIGELGLNPSKLLLAFGSGFTKKPLQVVREGVEQLSVALPEGAKILVAAMGPKMCTLAGEIADGVMLNWITPERAEWASERVEEGAKKAGRPTPPILGYVRVAVDDRAQERLIKEEQFYRELHKGYVSHFADLDAKLGTVGIATSETEEIISEINRYKGCLDTVVVRALASARFEGMSAVAEAAAKAL